MEKRETFKGVVYLTALFVALWAGSGRAQLQIGLGNEEGIRLASGSALVRSAERVIQRQIEHVQNPLLRRETRDALSSSKTCVRHRAGLSEQTKMSIVEQLLAEGLIAPHDDEVFPGRAIAGVFPPLLDEGSDCPHLPQTF